MKYLFDRNAGIILVKTKIYGPAGDAIVNLALDTGATWTLGPGSDFDFYTFGAFIDDFRVEEAFPTRRELKEVAKLRSNSIRLKQAENTRLTGLGRPGLKLL